MTYRLLFLIGLASLAAAPALPDIIDVTVSGSVSGSGTVLEPCDPTFTQGCMRYGGGPYSVYIPYSFNGTNTQIGSFSASSGPTVSGPGQGGAGFANENTSLSTIDTSTGPGQELDIELNGGHSAFGYAFSAEESAAISIGFELTQESELVLGSVFSGLNPNSGGLLDSSGNLILPIPLDGQASTVLPPGAYQLNDSDSGGSQGSFPQPGDVTDFDTLMYAQFTPVPEPRGAVFGALALMLITFPASRRRRAR